MAITRVNLVRKGNNGKLVTETRYSGYSCVGVFQSGHGCCGYTNPETVDHLEVSFSATGITDSGTAGEALREERWGFFQKLVNSQLMKSLIPDLKVLTTECPKGQAGNNAVTITFYPVGRRVDEVVCGLRLLKSALDGTYNNTYRAITNNFKEGLADDVMVIASVFGATNSPGSDAFPTLDSGNLVDSHEALKKQWEKLPKNIKDHWEASDPTTYKDTGAASRWVYNYNSGFYKTRPVFAGMLIPLLFGKINEGIMPKMEENGYQKSGGILRTYFSDPTRPNQWIKISRLADAELDMENTYPTVNHPLIHRRKEFLTGPMAYDPYPNGSKDSLFFGEGPYRITSNDVRTLLEVTKFLQAAYEEGEAALPTTFRQEQQEAAPSVGIQLQVDMEAPAQALPSVQPVRKVQKRDSKGRFA